MYICAWQAAELPPEWLISSRMMLASVTMGISVDDTIHFLARLRVVFSETGNYKEALRKTMHEVGIPLTITSFALMVAFSSYLLSDTEILASFGVLLCLSVLVGWLVELLVTPTLLVLFKPYGPEFSPKMADQLSNAFHSNR